jgi:hypothetical protein
MRPDDAFSLVFDGDLLAETLEIVGFPRVRLRASLDAPMAHFVARLEDVHPDGRVSLVTGGLLNASQRKDPLRPEPLVPGEPADLEFDLHFTTWTYRPGHRIRLAVTNAQFPMIWPTPHPMTMTLLTGGATSWLALPVVPQAARAAPGLLPPEPREERPDARYLECEDWPAGRRELVRDLTRGETRYEWSSACEWEIGPRRYRSTERNAYRTSDQRPAESSFRGDESHLILMPGRALELRSVLEVRSDATSFLVTFTRRLLENDALVRERQWAETIPRAFQ